MPDTFSNFGGCSSHLAIGFINGIYYFIYLSGQRNSDREGYLFVCPLRDLRSDVSGRFRTSPACPAYWTLDPLGVDRLSSEDAKRLGFPELSFSALVGQRCWDESVYNGLRQFHAAKGFDPDSQDVARHVRVPLYQLSARSDALFAHGEFIGLCSRFPQTE